jgi:type IV pilus assembly protein PilE
MNSTRGFSLIELMIVVVIMGILMAISIPMYRDYVLRSHRTDAHSALLDIASRQERFIAQNNEYTKEIEDSDGLGLGTDLSREGYYKLKVGKCQGGSLDTCYLITASAEGEQKSDTDCKEITYDSAGVKSGTTEDCW